MTYRGHIKNGRILLNEPADLPEGSAVTVVLAPQSEPGSFQKIARLADRTGRVFNRADERIIPGSLEISP